MNRSFVTFNGINDALEKRLFEPLAQAAARHVHFAFHPRQSARWISIVQELRRAGVTTSWDFGWNEKLLEDRRMPELIRSLDYVFVNEQEALLYTRRLSLPAAIDVWHTFDNHVIVKLGARGSRWIAGPTDLQAPAPKVKALDTTGAGDAFDGGFLAGVLAGQAPRACLRLGNFVGAMSTRAAGGLDGLPRLSDVPAALRRGGAAGSS